MSSIRAYTLDSCYTLYLDGFLHSELMKEAFQNFRVPFIQLITFIEWSLYLLLCQQIQTDTLIIGSLL